MPTLRRDFLKTSAAAMVLSTLSPQILRAGEATPDPVISLLIQDNDKKIPQLLAQQESRLGHRWIGGLPDAHGIHTVAVTNGMLSKLAASVCSPGSKYFESEKLIAPMRAAIRYMLAAQHPDGTIDYYATNFHSPPDLAFNLEIACPTCLLLRASAVPAIVTLSDELGVFITRAAAAIAHGGVHTPNHRWVVCSALAWAHTVHPHPSYVARIDQWLAEEIDLDPDGQYTEKSTTVYSPIVDRALITVARLLKRPELYQPVRKNLEMMLYYVHPDGEVVTEASRRQDRNQRSTMSRYYYAYRTLALLDGNGRFAAMCQQIEQGASPSHPGELADYLAEPAFGRPLPPASPLPTDYAKLFSYSSLARIRRGQASGTILGNNTTLFSFHKGTAILDAVRLATAFFGKGQFTSETLTLSNGRYVLRQVLDGPYFQPLTKEQISAGEHTKMAPNGTLSNNSRALRVRSNVQTLEAVVSIGETAGKFDLAISVHGTEEVPVVLELIFRQGGALHGVAPIPNMADAFILNQGTGRYVSGNDTIEFGPGKADHTYTQVRGALPKAEGLSVYLTGMTPFEFTLTIS
ncbi:MAG: hypothetical protein EBT98_03870 [Opitutaceae bacterium]|nr:hypothetical protein [Opitutaceae bacterium]NBR58292.1 hypothetical protein [Opitutaceae bacterium]